MVVGSADRDFLVGVERARRPAVVNETAGGPRLEGRSSTLRRPWTLSANSMRTEPLVITRGAEAAVWGLRR